jgi:hypothetical protein
MDHPNLEQNNIRGSYPQTEHNSGVMDNVTSPEKAKDAPHGENSQRPQEATIPDVEKGVESQFQPGWRFFIAFTSVSAITLMVALDATSLGNALPVS